MEVENAVSGVIPEYPVNARSGSDLVTEKAMTCGYHQCHAHQTIGQLHVLCGWGHYHPGRHPSRQERNAATWGEDDHSVPLSSNWH